jgi:putative transposase
MSIEYRKQAHCTCHARYHLVFVTKHRRKMLKQGMGKYLLAVLRKMARQYPEIEVLEMGTDQDHVHPLAVVPPKTAVSDAVRILKSLGARMLKKRFPFLSTMYDRDDMPVWSEGYFVSTVGCDEKTIKRYTEAQGREDKGQTAFVW